MIFLCSTEILLLRFNGSLSSFKLFHDDSSLGGGSDFVFFHAYLGRIPILNDIFQTR